MITDHPNFEAIRSFVNSILAVIADAQKDYHKKNEKYFQGLTIPSQKQLSGDSYDAVDFGLHPDDQSESWLTFLPDHFNGETRIPVNVSVQIYSGPEGGGWIFRAEFWKDDLGPDLYGNSGTHWTWQHHEGAENRSGIWDDWYCQNDNEM